MLHKLFQVFSKHPSITFGIKQHLPLTLPLHGVTPRKTLFSVCDVALSSLILPCKDILEQEDDFNLSLHHISLYRDELGIYVNYSPNICLFYEPTLECNLPSFPFRDQALVIYGAPIM